MKNKFSINTDEIRETFKEEYKKYREKSTKDDFEKFFQFLAIDLRDWVKENTREFYRQKNNL